MNKTITTEDRVFKIVSTHLGLDSDFDKSDTLDEWGADSLDVVEIVMELEREFSISIPDEDVEDLMPITTNGLAQIVSSLINKTS